MRGTLILYVITVLYSRITPAHAGNTNSIMLSPSYFKDHPRPCGEHSYSLFSCTIVLGSPPPMRGTRLVGLKIFLGYRITPAHAGNTFPLCANCQCRQDHPRPCGEHTFALVIDLSVLGSPPPMRGTLVLDMLYLRPARITPAHAGNTTKQS